MVLMGRTAHLGLFAAPGARDRARRHATRCDARHRRARRADYTRISGGQRQLVLIARALAQDAPAIVMDEPTASLDFGNQVLVLAEISGWRRRAWPCCSPPTIPTMPSASPTAWRCSTGAG